MALASGTRLGPYEITAQIGVGGMGEVYRARDSRLDRDVAIKVLPAAVATDPDRIARFEREAKTLAALNHPNIAHLYGLEQVGETRTLVMELVEGPTLADRIIKGPIAVDDALAIAKQMAEALEAAHAQGIIHRDLKPANVKVRDDGTVKVLDFGLAKAIEGAPDSGGTSRPGLSMSPTITSPAQMTGVGVILGTAAYMSPEQARGKPVDQRADIWAFGCVLYEMLTGKRAFDGEDVSVTLAAVLRAEPDWSVLPRDLPVAVERLLRRCLHKDPRTRLHDIADAQVLTDELSTLSAAPEKSRPAQAMAVRGAFTAAVVGSVVIGTAIGFLAFRSTTRPASPRVERFELVMPRSDAFTNIPTGPNVVISPDGSEVIYHVQGTTSRLAVRRLAQLEQMIIPGTEGATSPFFSPDGTHIAFVTPQRKLVTLALAGGPPVPVCDLESQFIGGSWGPDDLIVFAQRGSGLFRVAASGGTPEKVAARDNKSDDYFSPEVLPGGKAILASVIATGATLRQARVVARVLASGETKTLIEGASAGHYLPTGHLVYQRAGTLMAVPFDVANLQTSGSGVLVESSVMVKASLSSGWATNFSVASDGTLVRATGTLSQSRRLIWVDRGGKHLAPLTDQALDFPRYPRLSPHGDRLAVTTGPDDEGQIWIYDLKTAHPPQILTSKGHNLMATWTPDGTRIAFVSTAKGGRNIFSLPADGSSSELVRLTQSESVQNFPVWSPSDNGLLMFAEVDSRTRTDLWVTSVSGDHTPRAWLNSEFDERDPAFSPDGHRIAYVSDPTGSLEVYVRPFPERGTPTRVSPSGGRDPLWSHDGTELFYQSGAKLMSVRATPQELGAKPPSVLFEGGFVPDDATLQRTYDVAKDGRFLMIEPNEPAAPLSLVLVKNWVEEVKRLVPTK